MMHDVFRRSESAKTPASTKHPANEIEKFVLGIPDIKVWYDPTDRSYIYELDDAYFDSPNEVMNYLIDYRSEQNGRAKSIARKEMYEFIGKKIAEITLMPEVNVKPKMALKIKGVIKDDE